MAISGTYADGDAININDCEVEVDLTPASSSYANIDSWATEIAVTDESVESTEVYPFTHTGAIVFTGNPNPVEVTTTVVYTEDTTDPYQNIKNQTLGALTDVRWSPNGGASGDLQFTTSGGRLISRGLPQGAGDGSTATQFPFMVKASSVGMGTIV